MIEKIWDKDLAAPPIVVMGSAHVTRGRRRLNRATTLYRQSRYIVTHDKITRFTLWEEGEAYQEGITSGRQITVHSGQYLTLIVLICADALDENIQKLLADLRPHYLVIPCMTPKTEAFENLAQHMVDIAQSAVLVANGPQDQDARTQSAIFARPIRGRSVIAGRPSAVPGVTLLAPEKDDLNVPETDF